MKKVIDKVGQDRHTNSHAIVKELNIHLIIFTFRNATESSGPLRTTKDVIHNQCR